MPRESLRGGDDPEAFGMCCHQQLTGTSIGKLISLQLSTDMHGIFSSKVNCIGVSASIRSLNDDSLTNRTKNSEKWKNEMTFVLENRTNSYIPPV